MREELRLAVMQPDVSQKFTLHLPFLRVLEEELVIPQISLLRGQRQSLPKVKQEEGSASSVSSPLRCVTSKQSMSVFNLPIVRALQIVVGNRLFGGLRIAQVYQQAAHHEARSTLPRLAVHHHHVVHALA